MGGLQLKLRDNTAGTGDNLITEVTGIPVTAGAVYTIYLKVEGSDLNVRLVRDSDAVELVNESTTDSTLPTGNPGIIAYDDADDIQEIDVNSLAPPPTTTFTTDVITNNSGAPLANQLMSWEWYPSPVNRIGSLNSLLATTGSNMTDGSGNLTVTVAAGDGTLFASIDNGSASADDVYYESGTSA